MGRPLTPAETQSVEQALDFVTRLLDCAAGINVSGLDAQEAADIRSNVGELTTMLANGQIDVESEGANVQASTDSGGIHLNDQQGMYSMPGDMQLTDCSQGYFASLWTLIGVLFHEKYHFKHHTGLWGGGVKAVFDLVFGIGAYILNLGLGEADQRRWLHKEFMAYAYSHLRLMRLGFVLEDVCRENPGCIPCCDAHRREQRNAEKSHQDGMAGKN